MDLEFRPVDSLFLNFDPVLDPGLTLFCLRCTQHFLTKRLALSLVGVKI